MYQALDRTALLLRLDVFGSAPGDHAVIVDGLRATTVHIVADRRNLATVSGQTALVTLHNQLAMLGVQIDLDVPPLELSAPQPPLRHGDLGAALREYSDDLIPGGASRPRPAADAVFAIGDTPAPAGALRLAASGMTAAVSVVPAAEAGRWAGDSVAAMAAAGAAAAHGVRAAIPRIAERLGRDPLGLPPQSLPRAGRADRLDLSRWTLPARLHLEDVDLVSGGAIAQAALYALLRIDGLSADIRVIEPEIAELPNLNRYAMTRRSDVGRHKTGTLARFSTGQVRIAGIPVRLEPATLPQLHPLAPRVLVGVDHIPSRWLAQQEAAQSCLVVGASSHDYVLVSSHGPGTPCAGCVHPRDDSEVSAIPTISFVSFWAGLVSALELLRAATALATGSGIHVWPLGLENPRGLHTFEQALNRTCPLHFPPRGAAVRPLHGVEG
jgi:hypothetical protein